MRRYVPCVGVALVITIFGCAAPALADGVATDPLPSWTSDASAAGQLSPEARMEALSIRPPRGYTLIKQAGPDGSQAFAWKGAVRPDGTAPYLMVVMATAQQPVTPDKALAAFLAGVHRRRIDWTESPVTHGRINGLTFARAQWTGTEPVRQLRLSGFQYVALDGPMIIQISSQDVVPYDEQSLAIAEAAARTLRKP